MHLATLLCRRQLFQQQHAQRIRFLAGGAARTPDAQRRVGLLGADEGSNHLGFQGLERLGVAEEVGHADQQVAEKLLDFVGVLAQEGKVVGDLVEMAQAHAPLDPAGEHPLAVTAEIELRAARKSAKTWFRWSGASVPSAPVLAPLT